MLGMVAAVPPAVAADSTPVDVSATARTVSVWNPASVVAPGNTFAGLAETNVSVGIKTPGVPCENCVRSAGGNNVGLPWPVFAVSQGQSLTVSTWFQSVSYAGPCTAAFLMEQASGVVATGSYTYPNGCTAGTLEGVFFDLPVPATTGFTTVIGTVSDGSAKSSAVTFIYVQ